MISVEELAPYLSEIAEGVELLREAVDRLNRDVVDKLDSLEGTVMMYSGD